MAKKKAKSLPRARQVFTFFSQLVRGAVKVWLDGQSFVLPAEQIEDFIRAKVKEIAARK